MASFSEKNWVKLRSTGFFERKISTKSTRDLPLRELPLRRRRNSVAMGKIRSDDNIFILFTYSLIYYLFKLYLIIASL